MSSVRIFDNFACHNRGAVQTMGFDVALLESDSATPVLFLDGLDETSKENDEVCQTLDKLSPFRVSSLAN